MWHRKSSDGFSLTLILLCIVVVLGITAAGYYVYDRQSDKSDTNSGLSDDSQKEHVVLAVGDIACDPSNPNFNAGEGQNAECMHKSVVEAMNEHEAEAALLLGDIQYQDGRLDAFEKSFVPVYKNLKTKMIVAAGNHDWQSGNLDGYIQAFNKYFPTAKFIDDGKTYFSEQIGEWKIYVLDSECSYVGGCLKNSPQYSWLQSELAKTTSRCTIVAWHRPVFTSGLHRKDNDKVILSDLYNLISTNKVDILLTGHDHDYERFNKQTIDAVSDDSAPRSFVVGTGGAKLRPLIEPYAPGHEKGSSTNHGFLKLNLNSEGYSWQFMNINGNILDSGHDTCS